MTPSFLLAPALGLALSGCLVMVPPPPPAQPPADEQPGESGHGQTGQAAAADPAHDPWTVGPDGSASTPAAPAVVSVTLRNGCRNTVDVFYGDEPRYGSGTYSSLSGNSVQSKQMQVGDLVWLVDDSRAGIASATVSDSTRSIEVSGSCTELVAR